MLNANYLKFWLVNNQTEKLSFYHIFMYKRSGKHDANLKYHISNKVLLGYTATTKNVYYID